MSVRGTRKHRWWDFGGFYQAQPAWARKLYWFVTIPFFMVWGWLLLSGAIATHGGLALIVFGILFGLGVIHNIYFAKTMFGGHR